MKDLDIDDVIRAIRNYLNAEYETALKKAISEMKKPTEKAIASKSEKLKPEFEYQRWIDDLIDSVHFMQSQRLSFGTHTSKGIHSSVKSDNVIFINEKINLPKNIVGSHSIEKKIDANSNNTGSHAGHLKNIVNFLNLQMYEKKFYLWIKEDNEVFKHFFEKKLSIEDFEYLHELLNLTIPQPSTDERNKQLLFPTGGGNYHCIVPLYPSSLTNYLFKEVNNIRYSEASKQARQNRKDDRNHIPYRDVIDLAITKLGGDNAQNVSRLNNEQSGINFLLPSLPPPTLEKIQQHNPDEYLPSKFVTNIFNTKSIAYRCKKDIKKVFDVVEDSRNIATIRDKRKQVLNDIIQRIFNIAEYIRNTLPAGWSKDYKLDMHQKFWLDPLRAQISEEKEFAQRLKDENWHKRVVEDFSRWINALLQEEFPKYKADFSDAELIEWESDFVKMQKVYERAGKGVFL